MSSQTKINHLYHDSAVANKEFKTGPTFCRHHKEKHPGQAAMIAAFRPKNKSEFTDFILDKYSAFSLFPISWHVGSVSVCLSLADMCVCAAFVYISVGLCVSGACVSDHRRRQNHWRIVRSEQSLIVYITPHSRLHSSQRRQEVRTGIRL